MPLGEIYVSIRPHYLLTHSYITDGPEKVQSESPQNMALGPMDYLEFKAIKTQQIQKKHLITRHLFFYHAVNYPAPHGSPDPYTS